MDIWWTPAVLTTLLMVTKLAGPLPMKPIFFPPEHGVQEAIAACPLTVLAAASASKALDWAAAGWSVAQTNRANARSSLGAV